MAQDIQSKNAIFAFTEVKTCNLCFYRSYSLVAEGENLIK